MTSWGLPTKNSSTYSNQVKGASPEWNARVAVYSGKSFSFAAGNFFTFFLRADGLKMYAIDSTSDDVFEYTLSRTYDISSATFIQQKDLGLSSSYESLFFKPDGLKMYVTATGGSLREYNLSTAWDVSTATLFQSFALGVSSYGLFFKPDGLKMYVAPTGVLSVIREYALSGAWNVSTATLTRTFSPTTITGVIEAVSFRSDGTRMYVVDTTGDSATPNPIRQYDLSTAWNISTAMEGLSGSVDPDFYVEGISFSQDGLRMYIIDSNSSPNVMYEYSLDWSGKTKHTASYTSPIKN